MDKELDPLIHAPLRLAVMSILAQVEEADFLYLQEKTNSTPGNLSGQMEKLRAAGYIDIIKGYKGKKPHTSVKVTPAGLDAFAEYLRILQRIIPKS
jgi:DNA-binding MarR family transcriptional regulator